MGKRDHTTITALNQRALWGANKPKRLDLPVWSEADVAVRSLQTGAIWQFWRHLITGESTRMFRHNQIATVIQNVSC